MAAEPQEQWTPRAGEHVKLTSTKKWGPSRGLPLRIQLEIVDRVTKAGFVHLVHGRPDEKFERMNAVKYREWHAKSFGSTDYLITIEPVGVDELKLLPTTNAEARAYAKVVAAKMMETRE